MNAIEKLEAERQRIVARLAEVDKILMQYEELQRVAESYLSSDISHTPPSDSDVASDVSGKQQGLKPASGSPIIPRHHKSKTSMVDFERIVLELLLEAEKPLDRSALYKALLDRGVVIGSPTESADLNTLSARMSRMKERVVNVSGYGYWPKERTFTEGGYEPQEDSETPSQNDPHGVDVF